MTRAVKGFRFSAMHCGLKDSGALDLGLLVCEEPFPAAGVFTQNRVRAAPVIVSERRLRTGRCQAILVNSGNANACTGQQGRTDALSTTRVLARVLGVSSRLVMPASTGVIGVRLPTRQIEAAIPALVASLDADGLKDFSEAILTTDRNSKVAQRVFRVGRSQYQVLGVAKGAGMIHPDMATTLAFVVTDAALCPLVLKRVLAKATERTFNRASVDGDTSTNDSIYLIASGRSLRIEERSSAVARFEEALTEVLEKLVKMVVADGEGARHLVKIQVRGARSDNAAVQIAKTVATSPLVKTAFHGCDPNWGRFLMAVGRSGVPFNLNRTSIRIGRVTIFADRCSTMTAASEARVLATMQRSEYAIDICVGVGRGIGHYWTCDLGHEYIRINADYRT